MTVVREQQQEQEQEQEQGDMEQEQATESLVRLGKPEEKVEVEDGDLGEKCEEVRRPLAQHMVDKKPPWMTSMVPTPLLPLPTLNFTVSQVRHWR